MALLAAGQCFSPLPVDDPSMRRLFWLACFVAAVAGPYLWSNPQVAAAWKDRALALFQQLTAAPPARSPFDSAVPTDPQSTFVSTFKPLDPLPPASHFGFNSPEPTAPTTDSQLDPSRPHGAQMAGPRLAGPAVDDLSTLLRFDIGPEWVTDHWSRVSTVVGDEGWIGLRVPVVTGMAADDLAGSLTYYFDAWRRLQRIAFQGATGDARRIVAWSASQGLRREPAFAAELFTRRSNGRATSVLAIQRPAVITSQLPNQGYEVLLEVSPPGSRSEVSRDMREWLRINRPGR